MPVAAFSALVVVNASLWVTAFVQAAPPSGPPPASVGQADAVTTAAEPARPRPTTSGEATGDPGPRASDAVPGPPRREVRIDLGDHHFSGRPHQTVTLSGVVRGVPRATGVRVERQDGGRWRPLPVPVMTGAAGHFNAYVEMGATGTYRLRVADAHFGASSPVVVLRIT